LNDYLFAFKFLTHRDNVADLCEENAIKGYGAKVIAKVKVRAMSEYDKIYEMARTMHPNSSVSSFTEDAEADLFVATFKQEGYTVMVSYIADTQAYLIEATYDNETEPVPLGLPALGEARYRALTDLKGWDMRVIATCLTGLCLEQIRAFMHFK